VSGETGTGFADRQPSGDWLHVAETPRTSYPTAEPFDVVLTDGSTVRVRTAGPDDQALLAHFLRTLPAGSAYRRFVGPDESPEATARRVLDPDASSRVLLATSGSGQEMVGGGSLTTSGEGRARVALVIDEEMQGRGLGTMLLAHLAAIAHLEGIPTLEAEVRPEDAQMRRLFRRSGLPFRVVSDGSTLRFESSTAPTLEGVRAFEERESLATARAIRRVLRPESVAVVGASARRADAVGSRVLANLLTGGWPCRIHAVHPAAASIRGVKAVPSLSAIDEPLDLVVVAVPAPAVGDVAQEAAACGAAAVLVLSAGFAETGREGAQRQQTLVAICREGGMRLVGPNSLGVLCSEGDVHLNATFANVLPPSGRVALMSQSGAVGIALLDRAARLGIGISSFVSAGNKPDLSSNDFLQYWEHDDASALVLLYLESFGSPRNFLRIAGRVARHKPIVALKSGRTRVGARAAGSHTGGLVAASDVTVEALFRAAGVIRAETVTDFLGVASLLERQPLPRGRRVAIVTNAGGPAVMCADACVSAGLAVPSPPAAARDELAALVPEAASVSNPIDMLAAADAATFRAVVASVARGGWADAIVVIFVPVGRPLAEDYEGAVARPLDHLRTPPPVLWVDMSSARHADAGGALPTYDFPEDAARALALVADYAAWRAAPKSLPTLPPDAHVEEAVRFLRGAVNDEPRWLDPGEVATLCGLWGIPVVETLVVEDAAAAGPAAGALNRPVALKALAEGVIHKTDAGAVELGLVGEEAVLRAARAMTERLASTGSLLRGFIVQPMVEASVEMLVGVTQDPSFGAVVVCGAGGVRAEIDRDIAVRLAPLSPDDAREAIRSLRAHRLLEGWRGRPRCSIEALEDLVIRTGMLAETHPEVLELDFNPVAVTPDGAVVVDARMRAARAEPEAPWPAIGGTPPAHVALMR
jgi:acetate---CoA ligase (ADP-forming)